MQKTTPLVLVLALAVTAFLLSVRDKKPQPQEAPSSATTLVRDDPTAPLVAPHPWPHEASDIAPDATTRYGALRNGMRYAIHPNAEPPGRVSLRLHIRAGSLMEADDQRGIAHFLEHMLFNGTRNYSPAEMIPRMQRLGIAFGAHANARTSFDETYYMLDLPDVSDETLQLAFTAMRDFADGALLVPEEIEKERGVVLAEKISRDSVGYRVLERQFRALMPDALLTHRFPIGTEEVIRSADRARFVDFYQRYYTPQRMTFIAAGDIHPDVMRSRIESAFSSMRNPESPGGDPDPGSIRQAEGIEPLVIDDKELASTDVALMLVRRHEPEPDTQAARANRLPLALAHSMLERRLGRIAREAGSPVTEGSAARNVWFNMIEMGALSVTAADDRWQESVAVLERKFRRAMEHGFLPEELTEAKSVLLNALEQQVRQQPTRRSEGIAAVMIRCIGSDDVFSDPQTDLDITRTALESMDAARCHEAFKAFWDAPGHHLVLTTQSRSSDAERELAACFEESRGTPVDPPEAEELPPFAYESFGSAGTVESESRIEDLGFTQLVLSNRVRVNLKRTDFETGRIRLQARIGSGQLTQPANKPMLDTFAQAVFDGGGLGKHPHQELERILAGRNVECSLRIDEDAFILGGTTTPGDFGLQCRLMCAAIIDPGYRDDGLWQFQKSIPVLMQQLKHTTAGPLREMQSWLHGGDSRYSAATLQQLASYTIADARNWLEPELDEGYLELSVVGDIDLQTALPELLATFGALPQRSAAPAALPEKRQVETPTPPSAVVFRYESDIPQAMAIMLWKTAGQRGNAREFRRLQILASVLMDRLREEIRENLGASYSPAAMANGSEALEDLGFVLGQSICNPEDIGKILNSMRSEAAALAANGASADELDRARRPILGILEKSLRDNSHWLRSVLGRSQAEPERIELARDRDADYRSITLDEINALAAKYLAGGNAISITIRPQAP